MKPLSRPALLGIAFAAGLVAEDLKIEVASIKPVPNVGRTIFTSGRTVHADDSLAGMIQFAFRTVDFRLDGLPGWVAQQGYDVTVKAEGDGPLTGEQFLQLLRHLMAEHFHLKTHPVTEEIPVYLLVIDKNGDKSGPKFRATPPGVRYSREESQGRLEATRYDMEQFARFLRGEVDRRVVDLTGLTGFYDLKLEWAPGGTAVASGDPGGVSIFTALPSQLGLRLVYRKKYPVEVLVVDHAEKPGAN